MMFPKPQKKKKKRQIRNPKPTFEDKCDLCCAPYAELHEVFYGTANRRISQMYNMQIRLCPFHHREAPTGVHHNKKFDLWLKRHYQRKFETLFGHEKFVELFGRNYLDERIETETTED